jgi:thiol-disulfide isomerase/thioredoxin
MKKIFLTIFIIILSACNQSDVSQSGVSQSQTTQTDSHAITGLWRGVLTSPGGELPFGIDIASIGGVYSAKILNGVERVDTSAVTFENNKLIIDIAWFDAIIEAKMIDGGNKLTGFWRKTASGKDKSSQLPFTATRGYDNRFAQEAQHAKITPIMPITPIMGSWKVVFSDVDGDSKAIAEFSQKGQIVNGTFLTPTGDYRYLAGVANNGKLQLSAFDGAHAFLFKANIDGDKISNGHFWSRDSYHATWTATKSNDVTGYLPSSWEMNKATKKVEFTFEDIDGNLVQLTDQRFEGKPVLINLFGTWCPNCNDEAPVLAKFYDKYKDQGLEIVGLAFEFTEDVQRDKKQLAVFKKRHGISYPLLLAGGNDKDSATKVLGFMDKIKSYPTTLFLDRNHEVVKINTGFSGPGTGEHFTELVKELEVEIQNLLK